MSREFTVHPAADIFPRMSREDFAKLKEDIRVNGLRSPIMFWRGQLIDGRHRIEACEELGIGWDNFAEEVGADRDPVTEALSLNLHRRHLTPSQLSMVADKVRGIYDEEGETAKAEGQKSGGQKAGNGRKSSLVANFPPSKNDYVIRPMENKKSRDKAAAAVGVSGKLADAAKKVRTKGTPELQKAVESGEVAVTAAALVADLPKQKQTEIVSRDKVKESAADIREEKRRAAAAAKGADEVAVKALLASANPLCVIEKAIAKFTQEQITSLYLRCEELLDKVTA
jgi:ParB-like chromosome segregation protein Spo0J